MPSSELHLTTLSHTPQALLSLKPSGSTRLRGQHPRQLASQPAHRRKPPSSAVLRPREENSLLDSYLAEVRRHPLLTQEEELSLARRVRRDGDRAARIRLVSSHLRLVVKMAREHLRPPLVLMDLIQEGNLGLVHAVERFDPERGVTLSAYAAWWIRAYLLRFIMENWKLVKLGTTEVQRKLFFRLRAEQRHLLAAGLEPTPRLLAERLHVPEQAVVEMNQRLHQDDLRLDMPTLPEGDTPSSHVPALISGTPAADDQLAERELKQRLKSELVGFTQELEDPRGRFILEHRLLSETPLSLAAIGQRFGVSRERARQVEAELLQRLRDFLRRRLPDFDWLQATAAPA
jgi:RNA polymerase sigma-32 factor